MGRRSAKDMAFDKYQYIMEHVRTVDVSADKKFQRTFNGFYKIRYSKDWTEFYYQYFEQVKKGTPTFEDIITYLYDQFGRVEASFSSKMLATIVPEKPIWDQYVLQNLKLELKDTIREEKLKQAIFLYDEIEEWYDSYLKTRNAIESIQIFDAMFPDAKWLSNTKKIDYILWSKR